jgi:DNA-binding MarR family transcriptional regulator
VLSTRLKELEQSGVVQRRVLPRPSAAVVYELTEYGRELEDAVMPLLRWGSKSLGERRPEDVVTPSSMALGLRLVFDPQAARGVKATYELRFGDAVVHLRVDDGKLEAGEGPAVEPDLTIASDAALATLMVGQLSPTDAERTGAVRFTGDSRLIEPFTAMFSLA